MSTEAAQRRVLETLANLHEGGRGVTLSAFSYGLREMAEAMSGTPGIADLYEAMADLADAVRTDLTSKENSR